MTHLTHMPLTLAVDPGLIFTLIIFAVIAISKVAAAIKGDAKPGTPDPNTDAARAARQARLDAMAKRRREQMQQATGTTTPTNMTAQQASERQQAKTIYERRAEALRRARQQTDVDSKDTTEWKADRATVRREAQNRADAKAKQEQQQRAQAQAVAREQAARQQQEQAKREAASAEAERRRHLNAITEREEQLAEAAAKLRRQRAKLLGTTPEPDIDHSQDPAGVTHRRVTNTHDEAYALRADGQNRYRAALTGQSLRTALILREILGPPKALQQSDVDRPY